MKVFNLENMVGGWFVGNFCPAVINHESVEVAVKIYRNYEKKELHFHDDRYEITAIAEGCVRMNGNIYKSGDIVLLAPGEGTDFEALTDNVITTVVKIIIK